MLDKLLHLLKEFPDKWVLFILCILVGAVFLHIRNDFSSQLLNSVISALIGLLIGRSRNETNVKADTVQTPNVNTASMNDAVISTENVSNTNNAENG